MKHLGDITKIDGHNVPLVDIVTGGSPCQDLSVAGKRAGLEGARSGLFMEQIRIIKEMRDECIRQLSMRGADVDIRFVKPRYMVWENVPGAFSSNKGEDFRCVLEETAKIVSEDAVVPRPEGGRWSPSGCIMGDGWSIAWRVHDAQFWGVPQRRKRIALVADFGGDTAPKILFERQGLSRDIEESREEGQEVAGAAGENIDKAISFQERAGKPGGAREYSYNMSEQEPCQHSTISQYCLNDQGGSVMGVSEGVTGALRAQEHGHQPIVYGISSYDSNAMKSSNPNSRIYEAETTRTLDLNGGNPACNQGGMIVLEGNGQDAYNDMLVVGGGTEPITAGHTSFFLNARRDGKADTIVASDYKDPQIVCYGLDRASFNQGQNAQYDFSVTEEQAQTLVSRGPGGGY